MIDKSIFDRMDEVVEKVGSDPKAISDYLKADITPAYGSINGMVTRVSRHYYIALNDRQPGYQRIFAHHHENCHIIEKHVQIPGFLNFLGSHADMDTFSLAASRRVIAYTERICNLNAARLMFDGRKILQMVGYEAFENLRNVRNDIWKARKKLSELQDSLRYNSSTMMKCKYAEAKKELKEQSEKLMDLSGEFSYSDFFTIEQVARHFGVPQHYIEYALEAQRLLGADIDVQELRSFEKVFSKERRDVCTEWWADSVG